MNIFSAFVELFKSLQKNLDFHSTVKAADLQDIIYATLGDDFKFTIINFYLFAPIFTPSAETQARFIETIKNDYTISFVSWYTDRKLVSDGL